VYRSTTPAGVRWRRTDQSELSTEQQDGETTMIRYGGLLARGRQYVRSHRRVRILVVIGLPLLVLGLFFLIPLFLMFRLSLLEDIPPADFTFDNYLTIFTEGIYLDILWFTLYITVLTTVIVVAAGYALAYAIIYFSRQTTLLLLLIILPFWVNYIVRMYAWINILQTKGLIDWFESLLLGSDPSGYMFSTEAVLVGFVYIWLPLSTLPMYASIKAINDNLKEAAKDLGAGPIRTFLTVTLPQTKGGIIAGTILVFIPTFGAFITPSLLGGVDHLMIGMVIETQFNQAGNWPLAAALGTVLTFVVVLFLVIAATLTGGLFEAVRGENGE
jgi:spermidine/putrescine transport system permease protein